MPGISGLHKKHKPVRQESESWPAMHEFERHLEVLPIVIQRSELRFIDFGPSAVAFLPVRFREVKNKGEKLTGIVSVGWYPPALSQTRKLESVSYRFVIFLFRHTGPAIYVIQLILI